MNLQEIFDKVCTHAFNQNENAQKEDGTCCYRYRAGPDKTLKCFIGCLIKDEFYCRYLEGMAATGPDVTAALALSGVTMRVRDKPAITDLQMIHDAYAPDAWGVKLAKFAKYYRLDVSIVNKLWGEK